MVVLNFGGLLYDGVLFCVVPCESCFVIWFRREMHSLMNRRSHVS